jgi:argininosuccinate lyase
MLAEKKDSTLENLTIEEIKTIIPNAETMILDILKIESSVSKRTSYGGTAPDNVLQAIKKAKERFLKD